MLCRDGPAGEQTQDGTERGARASMPASLAGAGGVDYSRSTEGESRGHSRDQGHRQDRIVHVVRPVPHDIVANGMGHRRRLGGHGLVRQPLRLRSRSARAGSELPRKPLLLGTRVNRVSLRVER